MAYPPGLDARIKELEAELKLLKKERVVMINREDLSELTSLTNLSWEPYHAHISWLSRAVICCGPRRDGEIGHSHVRTSKQMTYEETKRVAECASEIVGFC